METTSTRCDANMAPRELNQGTPYFAPNASALSRWVSQTATRRAPAIWPVPRRLACRPAIRPQPNKAILIIILPELLETQADLGQVALFSYGVCRTSPVQPTGGAPKCLSTTASIAGAL